MTRMMYYISRDAVLNMYVAHPVMGMMGQHHVHTPKQFKIWAADVRKDAIKKLKCRCNCGMRSGEVVDGSGIKW